MPDKSPENTPLLGEENIVIAGDEATPNYPRSSRRRILPDLLAIAFLVVLAVLVVIIVAVKKPTQDYSLLKDIRKLYNVPSLAAGALRNGSFDVEVTGVRKSDDPTLVTADDLWHLGSNTKAMTATLLAVLIEDGLLTWETTILEALPEWEDKMSEAHMNTTLAMIGAHRSGLSDFWCTIEWWRFFASLWNVSSKEGRGMVAKFALTRPPIFTPGTRHVYSNTGYIMLGYIMEQVTGESWEHLIQTRIFDPLEMRECRIGISLDTSIPPTNAWPHLLVNPSESTPVVPDKYGDLPLVFASAGLAFCSLNSYSKFLRFHLDGYKRRPSTENITLSEDSFKRLHEPWPGQDYSSGGWATVDVKGAGHVLMHSGSNNLNYLTAMVAPDIEGAFVASTNVGFAANATAEVITALVDGELLP